MTSSARRKGPHPSLPGFLFFFLAVLIPLFDAPNMVNADGDAARHVRHGETILQQRDVIRTDAFSFTFPGKEFVGFEYGSQILLALSHRIGGTAGLAALTTLVVTAVLVMMVGWLQSQGTDPLLATLAAVSAAVLTSIHWLARPHIFSWPFVMLLFFWLESRRRRPLWAFGILFALWANLHGAFVFGWLLIGLYFGGHVLEFWWTRDPEARQRERSAALELLPVLAVAVAATVINPYGWKLPLHVLAFFRDPWIPRLTQEFQSPDFLRGNRAFLIALMGSILVLALRPRPHWTRFLVITGTAGMALIMTRNIVQFGLLAVPLLTLSLAPVWRDKLKRLGAVQRFEAGTRTGVTAPYVAAGAILLSGLALAGGRVAGTQIVPEGFDRKIFPVDATAWARSRQIRGRIFHEFEWGGYLLYAWPEQPVFIDAGTDFYTGAFMRAQGTVLSLQPGWRDSLADWRIELALLATASPLASELLRSPAWYPLYCDGTAILLKLGSPGESESPARASCSAAQDREPGR